MHPSNSRAPFEPLDESGTRPSTLRPSTFRVWTLATRPHTLGASIVPVCVGGVIALRRELFAPDIFLTCTLAAISLQVATNLANDAFDYLAQIDDERRVGPTRVTQAGWLSARQVFAGVGLAIAVALSCGIVLVAAGGWPIVAIGLVSILTALAYSGGPFPLASHGLGEVAAFLFFGVVAVTGSAYLHTGDWSAFALVASLPIGCLVSAIMVVNNLRDIATDAAAGKRTLAVRIGALPTRRLYAGLLIVSYLVAGGVAIAFEAFGALATWLSFPLAVRAIRGLFSATTGSSFNVCLAQTAQVHAVYGALLCLGLIL